MVEEIRGRELLGTGEPVIVMVSGGRDSVCLLDLSVRIAGAQKVRALHVNYGLRAAAGEDEALCARLAARLEVPLEVVRTERPPGSGNRQGWARDVRYAAAGRLAERLGDARIATGHTASDQAETVLYRLASSPGRRALLGMPERDGRLVRPLLRYPRARITEYCRARGLEWSEDETNDSALYARGRVRNGLLPALAAVHPAAEANVVRTAELLRDEAEVLDGLVDELLRGAEEIALERLRLAPPALQRLVVQRLADAAAGRLAPRARRRTEEILALRSTGRAALDLGEGVRAVLEGGILRFTRHVGS